MQDKGLSRREFIKRSTGTAGLLAILSAPLVSFLTREKASDVTPQMPQSHGKTRAWAMIIDLKRCEGCVTLGTPPHCTQACIAGHFIPEGQQWIQVYQVELPGGGSFFLPTPCYQCENAPCVNVCPVAATYHDKDGVVLIDHFRCIGCRLCMAACPYQRRFFNWGDPVLPPDAAFAEYSPLYPVPAVKGTVIKCMFCAHLLAHGQLPYCVLGCPMRALYMGDLNEDIASNGVEVVRLSTLLSEGNAFRYNEELGTQPRVYYLPGHGEKFGRKADDRRPLTPPVWSWDGFKRPPGIFPWSGGR